MYISDFVVETRDVCYMKAEVNNVFIISVSDFRSISFFWKQTACDFQMYYVISNSNGT